MITKAKKLNKLAIRDKLKSPLPSQVKAINNKMINKIVWIPKEIVNSLTTYEINAKTIPIIIIFFHLRGILAITKAKVTTAICSGMPCKSKAINGIFINHTTSPTKR
ncbi:hypothetical protein [Desulfosporosinus sp. I2]|uniref:hypothetical protein n=1 Tax=Desulfosporosinus sp. I2 TaxID=1617025 RepID=UPI0012E078F7|nr:hypothetical protein [Desulfosporosinus sp. I2]